jgi:metal-responsive CopG/Arc/MetJ family transcriptional regulator
MGRIGIYLNDEVEKRLKDFVYKKTGSFRGQSEVAVEAIKEYLDRHESELEKSENPLEALASP